MQGILPRSTTLRIRMTLLRGLARETVAGPFLLGCVFWVGGLVGCLSWVGCRAWAGSGVAARVGCRLRRGSGGWVAAGVGRRLDWCLLVWFGLVWRWLGPGIRGGRLELWWGGGLVEVRLERVSCGPGARGRLGRRRQRRRVASIARSGRGGRSPGGGGRASLSGGLRLW